MRLSRTLSVLMLVGIGHGVMAAPVTVNGDPFTLVAIGPGTTQLFGLAADTSGRIYIGNNSNDTIGIAVQLFDPSLYSGSPISLQNFGPPVGDADGLTYGGGFIFVPDRDEGLRRIAVPSAASSIFVAGASINGTGSPVVYRPSDGHVFVGFGSTVPGAPGANRIDEYDSAGAFVRTFTTTGETETMTFDPGSGLIFYAPFGTEVRSFDPNTATDRHIGNATGFIDGGLAFDAITGLVFVGTANGANSGLVETIDPITGERKSFASGFNGSLGILRDSASGNLYFLEANQLYRLNSAQVTVAMSARLLNISTRLRVLTGDNVGIGGFVIGGSSPQRILLRGVGPSLAQAPYNVPQALADPILSLHTRDAQDADVVLMTNDNWKTNDQTGQSQEAEISATGLAPTDPAEAAIIITLNPGAYTVILSGKNGGTGNALVEAFNLDGTNSRSFLSNISTRGYVDIGDQVMIGGFIQGPQTAASDTVLMRAIGPSLTQLGVSGALADPTLELHDSNGATLASNDDWAQDAEASEIPVNLQPGDARESALHRTLSPGAYTAIMRGKNNTTGVGLVEVYYLTGP
ncbi:MAG TPA: hypothetical protein VGH08_08535 [Chthoniobacterales bacterium]